MWLDHVEYGHDIEVCYTFCCTLVQQISMYAVQQKGWDIRNGAYHEDAKCLAVHGILVFLHQVSVRLSRAQMRHSWLFTAVMIDMPHLSALRWGQANRHHVHRQDR